jgi:hypothetical protein
VATARPPLDLLVVSPGVFKLAKPGQLGLALAHHQLPGGLKSFARHSGLHENTVGRLDRGESARLKTWAVVFQALDRLSNDNATELSGPVASKESRNEPALRSG